MFPIQYSPGRLNVTLAAVKIVITEFSSAFYGHFSKIAQKS